jgi:hypothetical protein
MSKSTRELIGATLFLLMLAGLGLLAIFLFQSYFHPYEKDCHLEAVGKVCKVAYHLYWKPTLSI